MDAKTDILRVPTWLRVVGLSAFALAMNPTSMDSAQARPLREGHLGSFYMRSVLWRGSDITEPSVRAFYPALSEELKGWRTWNVGVFMDEADAARELGAGKTLEMDYDAWLRRYERFGKALLPMAEIWSSMGNAVARVRNSAGQCSEFVLAGDNFLHADVDGVGFELLKIIYHGVPPTA